MHHPPHKPLPASALVRLKRISIDNFKSLVGFEMDLAKFTCLVGLNGAGKSTQTTRISPEELVARELASTTSIRP